MVTHSKGFALQMMGMEVLSGKNLNVDIAVMSNRRSARRN
jgi:acetolactate synthase regulatory subunit